MAEKINILYNDMIQDIYLQQRNWLLSSREYIIGTLEHDNTIKLYQNYGVLINKHNKCLVIDFATKQFIGLNQEAYNSMCNNVIDIYDLETWHGGWENWFWAKLEYIGYSKSITISKELSSAIYPKQTFQYKQKKVPAVKNTQKKIVITSDGHEVRAKMGNKVGIAKCNLKKDTFDYQTGVELAIKRLFEPKSEFNIGDTVTIVNPGSVYSTYTEWFNDAKVDSKYCLYWQFEQSPTNKDLELKYQIVAKHPHWIYNQMLYLIYNDRTNNCYLIGERGLKLFNKGE